MEKVELEDSCLSSQSFSSETTDIDMNVLTPLNSWISGSIPNEGWIIKHSSPKKMIL